MKIPQDDINAVRTAMQRLHPRHLTWCVDAALHAMTKNATAAEEELARHTALSGEPNYTETRWNEEGFTFDRVSRSARIVKLRDDLVQYSKIIEFLRVLRDAVIRFNAEHTTIEFGDQ